MSDLPQPDGEGAEDAEPGPDAHDAAANFSALDIARAIAPQLERIRESILKSLEPVVRQYAELWKPALEQASRRILALAAGANEAVLRLLFPRNLHTIALERRLGELDSIIADGYPVAYVPPASVVERLLKSEDSASRREVWGRSRRTILDSCRTELALVRDPGIKWFAVRVGEAIDAVESGFVAAGQTLAVNVIDSIVEHRVGRPRGHFRPGKFPKSKDLLPTALLVLRPLVPMLTGQRPGFEERRRLNRNLTAHDLTPHQISKLNASLAIAHATALLRALQDGVRFVEM
ncbi:hypothetical protein [Agrococcus citreus]|uniref:Uncharacterized protein n=1 Tax=Agrococcus citreus TaxID=84643 RepID=A0ABP4JF60_9MICO